MKRQRFKFWLMLIGILCFLCACEKEADTLLAEPESSGGTASISTSLTGEIDEAGSRDTENAGEPLETLLFASDYQQEEDYAPKPLDILSDILTAVYNDGIMLDNAVFCGDYTNDSARINYNCSPESAISEIKEAFLKFDADFPVDTMLFSQGNHDELTESVAVTGLYEFEDYFVYVLNTETDYPWHQGSDPYLDKISREDVVEAGAERLQKALDELIAAGESRPVFIAGHVPLHYTARTSTMRESGDNLYSSYIFDVVNEAAQTLDVVYLFGHNHSGGWDNYLGGSTICLQIGDRILLPHINEGMAQTDNYDAATLNFTYINAGYVGYDSSIADNTLTCTVCEIYDTKVVLTRYSANGPWQIHGEGRSCDDPDDTAIIPEDEYVKGTTNTSVTVNLKN